VRGGERREEKKGRGRGPGRAGLARKEERREEEKSCWLGCKQRKGERGEGRLGWAQRREKRRREKEKKEEQLLLNLNMEIEFKLKSKINYNQRNNAKSMNAHIIYFPLYLFLYF
jgi:hypothetical protein